MKTLFTGLKKISMTAVLAASLGVGVPAISQATPILPLSSVPVYPVLAYRFGGAGSYTFVNASPAGIVSANGSIGSVIFSFSGASKPPYGSEKSPKLHLNTYNFQSGSAGTSADVWLTETGFSPHGVTGAWTPVGLWTAYAGLNEGQVRFSSYADSSNSPFGTGLLLGGTSWLKGAVVGGSWYSAPTFDDTFSLTLRAQYKLPAHATSSADQSISVPEPSILGMVGLGLLMVGLMGLRFRQARYRGDHSKA